VNLNTGGRYDPAADCWRSMSTTPHPTSPGTYPSVGAPAVKGVKMAGNEILFLGGFTSTYVNTGGRYDAGTNTWLAYANPTTVTLPARTNHTMVWTGTQVIVFGGSGSSITNTGGMYTPGGSWVATNTSGAVTGIIPWRVAYHTAVWTGTRMVVFGGQDHNANPNNYGYEFDPATNSWDSINDSYALDAPQSRYRHASVWTGTRLLIWGGVSFSSSYITDGKSMHIADGTTQPMATTSEPSARSGMEFAWTGSKLLVWGGGNSTTMLNDGGIFTP